MYAMTLSGRTTVELKPADQAAGQLVQALGRLNGEQRFSLVLFELPVGVAFDDVDLSSFPKEYLQCAGSQERMTVEVRVQEADGLRQYALGHGAPAGDSEPDEVIRWSTFETPVHHTEIFTGEEAAEIFAEYLGTRQVPSEYHRRLLEL